VAHIEKRGAGRWRARYRGPDRRERSNTFARKVDVERWLAGIEVSKAKGEWIDPAAGRITLEAWWPNGRRRSTFGPQPWTFTDTSPGATCCPHSDGPSSQ
jgi:hypothetical protein